MGRTLSAICDNNIRIEIIQYFECYIFMYELNYCKKDIC